MIDKVKNFFINFFTNLEFLVFIIILALAGVIYFIGSFLGYQVNFENIVGKSYNYIITLIIVAITLFFIRAAADEMKQAYHRKELSQYFKRWWPHMIAGLLLFLLLIWAISDSLFS